MILMWAYEAARLFRDRLVSKGDQDAFDNILQSVIQSDWSSVASGFGDLSKIIRFFLKLFDFFANFSLFFHLDTFFVTYGASGGHSPGAPLPPFGKTLGRMKVEDFVSVLEKGINRFSKKF